MRKSIVALLVCLVLPLAAAPAKRPAPITKVVPTPVAPESLPHPFAIFLRTLSDDGGRQVTFRATAIGMRFFIEEPAGVTVYAYDGSGYKREAFLPKTTLAKVVPKYAM
ncbi:MAG TPA: hypothetical protein VF698_11280 [Thermoanaerobaculia bacterium]|jgi:hypothetical protein